MVQGIENAPFGAAPLRSDQQLLRTVSGETVDHYIRPQFLQTADEKLYIFFSGENPKISFLIIFSQICAGQNVEKLKFDSPNRKAVQKTDGIQHLFPGLSGKPQNHMDDNIQSGGAQVFNRFLKAGEGIAPAEILRGLFVYGLQPAC